MNTPAPLGVKLAQERVLGWQTKLHRWAAQDEQQRFGDLFNLVCDPATLLVAWERVKRNRGSRTAGVDGQTRRVVEQMGAEGVLAKLRQELKDGTYRPLAARERLIPKRSGKLRTLGISTVRDRIVQTAAKLVLEPIFEADFCPTSYGFRPGRRAQDAIEQVRFFINAPRSYEWVIEGDVEDCFGSIHQGLLMEQVHRRVTDKRVLALIRLFLAAGIMREQGSLAATPSGTPQGSGLSPLLSNIALSVLDRRFEAAWTARRWPSQRARDRANGLPSYRMIRFADLCGDPHKSAYAEFRVMPSGCGIADFAGCWARNARHNPAPRQGAQPRWRPRFRDGVRPGNRRRQTACGTRTPVQRHAFRMRPSLASAAVRVRPPGWSRRLGARSTAGDDQNYAE